MRKITEHIDWLRNIESDEDGPERWAEPEPLGIWVFDPGGSHEPLIPGQQRVITEPTIYLPYGSGIGAYDKCVVRGKTYLVEGDPAVWGNPEREPRGDKVTLKRVDG